ncbi:MAG: DUF1702 family protein, partial [bacterium]|nr:DUF1702 family protein [bacterium]
MGIRRRLFGISEEEVTFARRGFRGGDGEVRAHIEKVGHSFLRGYHAVLEEPFSERLIHRLEQTEPDYRGFTYEGAAMALTLFDVLMPWRRRRLDAFLAGAGEPHVYMGHVGAGWAIARLPFGMAAVLKRLDPLLRWLAVDGYGFHQGYFHWPRSVGKHEVPARVRAFSPYARCAFDQGLGRSLWFVEGADVHRIPATISSFPAARHADLWSGIGLSSTYAGGVDRAAIETLRGAAGDFRGRLAQGSAFAAKARQRAGLPTASTEMACQVLCGQCADDAAEVTDRELRDLPPDG